MLRSGRGRSRRGGRRVQVTYGAQGKRFLIDTVCVGGL